MSQLRAFIAIEFTPQVKDAIEKETSALRQSIDTDVIRWVAPDNLHLTLKFLGDVPSNRLEFIQQAMMQEAAHISPFEIQAGGLGAYPNTHSPRVLWVGLHAPSDLASLQKKLEDAFVRLGFPREERRFSPHLTIGRINAGAAPADLKKVHDALARRQLGNISPSKVDAIHLFKSDLTPSGAVYTKIFSANLNNKR